MADIIGSNYEIVGEIGSGGGGVVYLARHLRLGKNVVLKANKKKVSSRPGREESLRREVDVLKNLSHTYIPQVYDYFIENDTAYTVIDYVQGESLDKPLKRGERFTQPQVIAWGKQMLEALAYLHAPIHGDPPRGYIHSDVKPANLMLTPSGNICLIDFNIALALGEESAVGLSAGYASPEHYGLDYSSGGLSTTSGSESRSVDASKPDTSTITLHPDSETATVDASSAQKTPERRVTPSSGYSSGRRSVIPDARSDIYMAGATLYHLLSGHRPAKNAVEVTPLSTEEFSPQLVKIVTKAMNPNPDLRYQSAEEMLAALNGLRRNDPRVLRLRRYNIAMSVICALVFAVGLASAFIGLKRMQTTEQWLKLAEYSGNALSEGDVAEAVSYAMQALPEKTSLLVPDVLPQAQRALTDALGVYDLSDGYKNHAVIELPSEPVCIALSPEGKTAAVIYAWTLAIIDTDTGEIMASLPTAETALAQAVFLDENTLLYAGSDGLTAWDVAGGEVLWKREMATGIALSGDGTTVAAVYRSEDHACVYRVGDGKLLSTVDFGGRKQEVLTNDLLADPHDNLLALNEDGSKLCVSFDDGSVWLFSVGGEDTRQEILPAGSGYGHFEGGFYKQYLAFSASNASQSAFAIIDVQAMEQTGGFIDDVRISVRTDRQGICVQQANLLVRVDPDTGQQQPLVNCADPIRCFAVGEDTALIATADVICFYDAAASVTDTFAVQIPADLLQISAQTAVAGSIDSTTIRILRRDAHPEASLLGYDPLYKHDEARVSADGSTIMLFSFRGFRLYAADGELICETALPDDFEVYDQQYRRDDGGSRLEVVYNDGLVLTYSGLTGELLDRHEGDVPDKSLQEVFLTDDYEIIAPLHGPPEVNSRQTGEFLFTLNEDAYLAYVTQVGRYIVTQYIADGRCYGQLLDEDCQVLATLPYVCDVVDETLVFDCPDGSIRTSRIFTINELKTIAKQQYQQEEM